MRPAVDITGAECDGARVLHLVASRYGRGRIWTVRCACGAIFDKRAAHINQALRFGVYRARLRCSRCTYAAQRAAGLRGGEARRVASLAPSEDTKGKAAG